jgi:quercetin dioxygenase-like cupin family protein
MWLLPRLESSIFGGLPYNPRMADPRLARAIEQVYAVFARYARPAQVSLCSFCTTEEDLAYLRATPLREIDPERTGQLIMETADHFDSTALYKHYLPRILEGIAPPIRCEDLYPEHLFETLGAHGFQDWPAVERDTFWSYVVAVHKALEAIDPREAREWRIAAGKLAGGPFVQDGGLSSDALSEEPGGPMPTLIEKPTIIHAAGNKPKRIEEFVGRVNSKTEAVSIARMTSPPGWVEPGQTPEFDEYTVVLRGSLRVTSKQGAIDVRAGQAVITRRGEWVQYSTPDPDGAEYVAVCLPAFSPGTVHRD